MNEPGSAMRGTFTFLFSDIEGSTGLEQGTEGDSLFVAFREAADAVEAAVAAQRGLASEPWPDDAMVRVRMGLHTGGAEQSGESLVGLGINRAARLSALAHGGQILASSLVRDQLLDHPVDGV